MVAAPVVEVDVSLVIPVLNEEDAIGLLLDAAGRVLEERRDCEWEILVVDNASTDRTREVVEPFVRAGRVRLLTNDINGGKGYSIRRGMLEARGKVRVMWDADCEASLVSLPRMLEMAREADVVVGSRLAPGARVDVQQPLRRRVVGFGFLALSHALVRPPARDIYCGVKLWRGDVAEAVFSRSRLDGWGFDVEALSLARALGYRVRECGIVWVNRPASRLSIGGTMVPAVRELLAARRNVRRVRATLDHSADEAQRSAQVETPA